MLFTMLTKMCSKKTKGSMWNPKKINISLDKSVEKDFKILDLENSNYVNFFISNKNDESENFYHLKCEVLYKDSNEVKTITLGTFFKKEDAEKALSEIKVACYYPGKMKYKFFSGLILLVLLGVILFKVVFGFGAKIYPSQELPNSGTPNLGMMMPPPGAEPPMSPEQIQKAIEATQKEIMDQVEKGKQSIIDDNKRQAEQIGADLQKAEQNGSDPAEDWLQKMKK
jgi:hypothetical protein